jgi:hypothetical protein
MLPFPATLGPCCSRLSSFNMVSVDTDTSTSYTVLLLANGFVGEGTPRPSSRSERGLHLSHEGDARWRGQATLEVGVSQGS